MGLRVRLFTLFILSIFLPLHSALEEDTSFKARILGVSDSKRTVLVNRGTEHGLALNQHAKIALPSGMVARGVVVKLSPTRSVWSVYRFMAKDKITAQTVYNFKIASPVKLTTDESKALGALADKIDKKKEPIPQDPESVKEQKNVKRSIINSERVISQFDNVDYSKLNDSFLKKKKMDEDIDWSGLNGKKDADQFDASLDYSTLK